MGDVAQEYAQYRLAQQRRRNFTLCIDGVEAEFLLNGDELLHDIERITSANSA